MALIKHIQSEPSPYIADHKTVDAYVERARPEWLDCREGRHSWPSISRRAHYTLKPSKLGGNVYEQRLPCERGCGAVERVVEYELKLNRRGQITGIQEIRHYPDYVDKEYLLPKGSGRASSSDISDRLTTKLFVGKTLRHLNAVEENAEPGAAS